MTDLPCDFTYLTTEPESSATIRGCAEDFQVIEQLGFEPEGEGEHVFLYIRKTGENTDWVARQLANFAQVSPRDVSYAGKKDRHAVTEQWFCVKYPIKRALNWKLFGGDSIQVLKAIRHPRKLRLGTLKGNRFRLCLRDVTDMEQLQLRVSSIAKTGVPNYFGEQRFGNDFGNLDKGIALLRGEFKERQRHKKGIYISAVRSWLFNHLLSSRIKTGLWDKLLSGDCLMLTGSQSCFCVEEADSTTQQRLDNGEVSLTGPMWGRGELMTSQEAKIFESDTVSAYEEIGQLLTEVGLKQERRALCLRPEGLKVEPVADDVAWIEFSLPAGAFATSVLRELCHCRVAARDNA